MAAGAMLFATACTSNLSKLSVLDRDETPRTAALAVAEDLTPALEDVALLCETGIFDDNTIGAIAVHGPRLVDIAERYFESARQCVVIDGQLQPDPTVAGDCTRGTVQQVSRALPTELARASSAFGLNNDVGRGLFVASIVAKRMVGNNDGGVIDGFQKSDELSAAEYFEALAPLREARDAVAACVNRTLGPAEPVPDPALEFSSLE
jgi:hypothetical protein